MPSKCSLDHSVYKMKNIITECSGITGGGKWKTNRWKGEWCLQYLFKVNFHRHLGLQCFQWGEISSFLQSKECNNRKQNLWQTWKLKQNKINSEFTQNQFPTTHSKRKKDSSKARSGNMSILALISMNALLWYILW